MIRLENDKVFDLLTKMYSELTDKIDKIDEKFTKRFDNVEEKLGKVENVVTVLENRFEDSRKTLFDDHTQTQDILARIEIKLEELTDKVDSHDIKIQVIEGGKKKNVR